MTTQRVLTCHRNKRESCWSCRDWLKKDGLVTSTRNDMAVKVLLPFP